MERPIQYTGDTAGEGGTGDVAGGAESEQIAYGGGFQPGGGMVQPDEFDDAAEPGVPNDALAEGLQPNEPGDADRETLGGQPAPPAEGTVDPHAAPEYNDTGDRMGDVSGYLGSDHVVGGEGSSEQGSGSGG